MARICCACFEFTCRQSFSSLALQLTALRVSLRKLRMASSGISGNESGSGDSLLRFFAIRFSLSVANLSQARADSGAVFHRQIRNLGGEGGNTPGASGGFLWTVYTKRGKD